MIIRCLWLRLPDVSPVNMVEISTLADDDPTTITDHGPESLGVVVPHEGDDPAVDAVVFAGINMLYTYSHEVALTKMPKNCAAPIVVDDPLLFERIRNYARSVLRRCAMMEKGEPYKSRLKGLCKARLFPN